MPKIRRGLFDLLECGAMLILFFFSGDSYLKIMEAVVKQGVDFLKREERRVQNLLKGKVWPRRRPLWRRIPLSFFSQITNEKKQELQHRANILLSFKSLKEAAADAVDKVKEVVSDAADAVKEAVTGDKDL